MLATEFGTGQVFWSLLWFSMLVIFVYLFIIVVMDMFRSPDLNIIVKLVWLGVIFLLPFIGIFAYLIIRGHKMHEHAVARAKANHDAAQSYIRQAAAGAGVGVAGEIERLDDLRTNGVITDAEFAKRKAQLLES